jgi:hypothetical protein
MDGIFYKKPEINPIAVFCSTSRGIITNTGNWFLLIRISEDKNYSDSRKAKKGQPST